MAPQSRGRHTGDSMNRLTSSRVGVTSSSSSSMLLALALALAVLAVVDMDAYWLSTVPVRQAGA